MKKPLHHKAFLVSAIWTLGLLFLGSVVHATGSSLACPDWPTCYGTLLPEMSGGVFWEHLHRLVAGGLVLIFLAGVILTWKEEPRLPTVRRWALVGLALLLIQAVLGGITVLLRLPDAVSTSHLGLAFLFLSLTTALTVVTSPSWPLPPVEPSRGRRFLRTATWVAIGLTFLQSLLGAAVRHTDSGMACPDVPRCLGQWIPPLHPAPVALHFGHRVVAVLLVLLALLVGHLAYRRSRERVERALGAGIAAAALAQLTLGLLSVHSRLAVIPVSLHTLGAAVLLALLVVLLAASWKGPLPSEGRAAPPGDGVRERGERRSGAGSSTGPASAEGKSGSPVGHRSEGHTFRPRENR